MSLVLYHRIDEPDSAAVRQRGHVLPALWDGARLHEGKGAVLAALETLRR